MSTNTELEKFAYSPQQRGYSVAVGGVKIIRQELDGGLPRNRIDCKSAIHTVRLSWKFTEHQYNYFMSFYRHFQRNPNQPWLALLHIDSAMAEEYECQFQFGTVSIENSGGVYSVSVTLDVSPRQQDTDLDESVVEMGTNEIIDTYPNIWKVPNVWMPQYLGA